MSQSHLTAITFESLTAVIVLNALLALGRIYKRRRLQCTQTRNIAPNSCTTWAVVEIIDIYLVDDVVCL